MLYFVSFRSQSSHANRNANYVHLQANWLYSYLYNDQDLSGSSVNDRYISQTADLGRFGVSREPTITQSNCASIHCEVPLAHLFCDNLMVFNEFFIRLHIEFDENLMLQKTAQGIELTEPLHALKCYEEVVVFAFLFAFEYFLFPVVLADCGEILHSRRVGVSKHSYWQSKRTARTYRSCGRSIHNPRNNTRKYNGNEPLYF